MSKKDSQEIKDQKKVQAGIRAEALLNSSNWEVMQKYISKNILIIEELLTGGLRPDIEDGIIVKTAEQKYWEYAGKAQVLKDIEMYLNRKVAKKNKLLEKEDEKHG